MLAHFPDWSGVFRASPYQSPIKRKRHRRSGDTEIDLDLGHHSKRPHTEGPGGTNLGSNATDKYRTHEEKGDQSTQDLIDTNAVVDAAVFVEHIAEDGVVEDEDSNGPAGNGDEDIQFTEQPVLEGLGLEELKQRIRFETEVVKFRCPLCLKLYSDYDAVVRHLKTVHKKGLDWWTCPRPLLRANPLSICSMTVTLSLVAGFVI
ncbi:hypothetical protein IEO21_09572 [Rhodonia placenta]|uniref:C2H2-type domain-containing protein n=1 Tax=Rhodonia placenta TaxID=104341 RepID=A0A8H7TYA3_9APHY|nr:hypothetical protein IEO21_09572 [Postia placenta]